MGRKSSSDGDGDADGGGGGGGGGGGVGPATLLGLRMIQCGRQTVDVILPDGQVRQFVVPVRVADLLHLYPHNYVSHATTNTAAGESESSRRSSAMLPFEAHLETGSIYVMLPLPRLFPSALPPAPHFCSCFFTTETSARFFGGGDGKGGSVKASSSKISPDVVGVSASSSSHSPPLPRRMWEPDLEIIAEDRVLVLSDKVGEAAGKKEAPRLGKKLAAAALDSLRLR